MSISSEGGRCSFTRDGYWRQVPSSEAAMCIGKLSTSHDCERSSSNFKELDQFTASQVFVLNFTIVVHRVFAEAIVELYKHFMQVK